MGRPTIKREIRPAAAEEIVSELCYSGGMSRRLAIVIALLAAAVFAVVYFWPKEIAAGSVSGRLHVGDRGAVNFGGVRFSDGRVHRHSDRWHGHHRGRDRWHGERRYDRRHDWRRGPRPLVIVPVERTIRYDEVAAPSPPAPAAPAAPSEALALDPQGRARTLAAPEAAQPREWVLGAVLPDHLPHVVLEPASSYGLPPPPEGQIYARVDGDVLRIERDSRRIVAVLAR